jgi:predicted PurR-regulated permease PerM
MVIGTLARLLRLASIAICLIAIAWFAAFAVEQTGSAAAHQQAEINGTLPQTEAAAQSGSSASSQKSGLRGTLNSAFSKISSPFSSLTSGSSSQWRIHIVDTLLALLLYGVGLGFVVRLMRFA